MEPAKIDWNNLDSKFVEDPLYEHINAPQWLDFSAPLDDQLSVDDHSWFCRPDCRHPKTAEDFLKLRPNPEDLSSSDVFEDIPLGEKKQLRDGNLKRRGLTQPSGSSKVDPRFSEDCENQNPNLETPHSHVAKSIKTFIKSSTEKKKPADYSLPTEEARSLKSTLSARNLFAGKDILNQITDFCHELKKLAMRAGEKDSVEKAGVDKSPVTPKREVLGELSGKEKERTPLMEVRLAKSKETEKGGVKGKLRRNKRVDDEENIPISLDLENVKGKGGDGLLPIRTYPPSPQCFSATRPPIRATPSKVSRSKPMQQQQQQDRGILGEVGQSKEEGDSVRGLDVFWFLKPCTHSSST